MSSGSSVDLVPIHVGLRGPCLDDGAADHATTTPGPAADDASLEDATIEWSALGLEPRWLGMESSECAAAVNPSIFHGRGGNELDRFLEGVKSRGELALIVSAIGGPEDEAPRHPFARGDASILLPGAKGSIAGERLPSSANVLLVSDLAPPDRDLGLRILNRAPDPPWWRLSVSGTVMQPGDGGPSVRHEPGGHLMPIAVDGLGDPVVAAWVPDTGDQRWYVIPGGTSWAVVLDWLARHGLPTYVPGALRRAQSSLALDPSLQTPAEIAARGALARLDAEYAERRDQLEAQLERATADADPIRHGLLYATGDELEDAVATVLRAAGFEVVKLDELLGGTVSTDLLAIHADDRRQVEVKSAGGNPSESLVGQLQRHLDTWPQLRSNEPVAGGVLVVNHQHRLEPGHRTPEVYSRPEFVASLTVRVLSTRELFDRWREADWDAIRAALLARPRSPTPVRQPQSERGSLPDDAPTPRGTGEGGRWARMVRRHRSTE